MKSKRIGVRLGYKVNMGNYETLDIDYSFSAELDENEDKDEAFEKIKGWVDEKVGEEMQKAREASRVNKVTRK